jgi:glutathione S-transferase
MPVELYDNPFSPYAFKVRAALYEKGIAHEQREIRTHADRETLLCVNARGEVPALVDGAAVLCDSKVICAYLEDRDPEPALVPRDPAARARCRYLELKSDTDVDAAVFVLGILKLTRPDAAKEVPDALALTERALARHCDYLDRELAGREWFLGSFSLVDIALTPHLRSAAFLGCPPDAAAHPGLTAWLARGAKRPSLRRAMRELAAGFAASQQPDSLFDARRLHWRSDRIEFALRVGLGEWLADELARDRAFLSPIP